LYQLVQRCAIHFDAVALEGAQQLVDIYPAATLNSQPQPLRPMAKMSSQILA
jgi:hypothetical protein